MTETLTLFVTGAGGHFGRRVVDLLLEKGGATIVAGSRDPGKLAGLGAAGAELRKADFDDAASLDAAFAGVDRLLIVSTDALGQPGLRLAQHRAAVDAAVRAGVQHIVYTSMPQPEPGNPVLFAPDHYGTEQAIEASGIPFTILRNSWYVENLYGVLPGLLASGTWYTSAGDGRTAFVSRDDLAAAAAAALRDPPAGNVRLTLTGTAALTNREIAAVVTDVFGKPVTVVDVDDAALAAGMAAAGLPDFLIPLLVSFDANTRAGGLAEVTDAIERLTGSAPASLETVLRRDAAGLGLGG
ncbi:SDR family oxidoreductase [Methylobrevis albus]|uniref:SDR family oxidoreductase n=1 Tax=Methylobrevis albus TaxID=2793297 RepID=A0A931I2R0_9HYPH|nr:SDR family oxidoreductase [Methylobrevis albus]MBH0238752.1 SDR family oxidoreductase [Methylobrevis albus]